MTEDRDPFNRLPRGLICGPDRSDDFKAGHRMALRAAVAWLHAEAKTMNDPKARAILNSAAHGLGVVARQSKQRAGGDTPDP